MYNPEFDFEPVTDEQLSRKAKATALYSPKTDPQGMYTGVPEDPLERPIQDVDDL